MAVTAAPATAELKTTSACALSPRFHAHMLLFKRIALAMNGAFLLQVYFAPPKPDEGDGEIIDWVEEEEDAGYMTPPTDTQPAAGALQPRNA